MLGKDYQGQECALAASLEVVGERWTLLIVRDAFFGVRRYSDFVTRLDIPRAVLSDRLKGLVESGVMTTRDDPEHAGRRLYELTDAGKDLWPAVHALMSWGSVHRRRSTNVYRHAECDSELVAGGHCPRCGVTPKAQDVVMTPRKSTRRRRTDPISAKLARPRRLLEPVDATAEGSVGGVATTTLGA